MESIQKPPEGTDTGKQKFFRKGSNEKQVRKPDHKRDFPSSEWLQSKRYADRTPGIFNGISPIETIYLEKNRSSHFRPIKDAARIYREILKFGGVSLLSFGIDYTLYGLQH